MPHLFGRNKKKDPQEQPASVQAPSPAQMQTPGQYTSYSQIPQSPDMPGAVPYMPNSQTPAYQTGMQPGVQMPPQSGTYGYTASQNAYAQPQVGMTGAQYTGVSPSVPYGTGFAPASGNPYPGGQVPYTATGTYSMPQSGSPSQMGSTGPQVPTPPSPAPDAQTNGQDTGTAAVEMPQPEDTQKKSGFRFIPSFKEGENTVKRKVTFTPLHIGVMIGAVLLTGWYLFVNYAPQAATTATVKAGSYGLTFNGEALIVRNEVPYDADSVTSINCIATEQSWVSNNAVICEVFSSGFSTRELTTLQDYRDQIRDYEQELLAEETTYDARLERVEADVLTQAREFRAMLSGANGNLLNMERNLSGTITQRQQYLKEKYVSDQRLSRLLDDEQAQQQRIDSWTKTYFAARPAIVSFYTDGFEYGLTIQNCQDLTPTEVREMIQCKLPDNAGPGKSKTTIYRAVQDDVWYVLVLSKDGSWLPEDGREYDIELNQFENTKVRGTVTGFTRSVGELLVVLRVEGGVENALYMRSGNVRVGENVSTMMVPVRARYHQNDMDGVVIIDGSNRFFVPCKIEKIEGNNMYISSIQQGLLFEGQTVMLFN
ncbi:MAG: hypothetical protein IJ708_09510 [Clostridia bacterium]|nr:hypothetical protein [Clostridia bacterium]